MNDNDLSGLSKLAFEVTQNKSTEPPFSGEYHQFDQVGHYCCICCGQHLFNSNHKFYSSCGWPAFSEALASSTIEVDDNSHGMLRTEVVCKSCSAHLGHKFNDGPTGHRYCINSVALSFKLSDKTLD